MIWLTILALFGFGLFLSAFYSGIETGFYRANRAKFVLDSRSGDVVSKYLLNLMNRPTFFVATVLVGNNIANSVTSFSIVWAVSLLTVTNSALFMLLLPILLSPIIFVYGELLPKNLFYRAPNRLLRSGGPLFLCFGIILFPVSALLWSFGRLLQQIIGHAPLQIAMTLARTELAQWLQEGQEVGILEPMQTRFTQRVVEIGTLPIAKLCTPITRVASVALGANKREVYRLAKRQRSPLIAIRHKEQRTLAGYVRIIDLKMSAGEEVTDVKSLTRLPHDLPHAKALVELRRAGSEWGLVDDDQGTEIGLITLDQLLNPLFRES